MNKTKPTSEELRGRVAVSPREASQLLGIDNSTFYRRVMPLVFTNKIRSLMIGRSRRILVADLLRWIEDEANKAA